MLQRAILFAFCLFLCALPVFIYGQEKSLLRGDQVMVLYEEPWKEAAQEALDAYSIAKRDVEQKLGWAVTFTPKVVLVRDSKVFQEMVGSALFAAYAVPESKLIVIDQSRMSVSPFTIEVTLKHELCHLLLHDHLKGKDIPKWLEEGICAWVSLGFVEIVMEQKRSILNEALLAGRLIPLRSLSRGFPRDRESVSLAYEESKSIVSYMVETYGLEGLLETLRWVRQGHPLEEAVQGALGIPLDELEQSWTKSLKKGLTWFTYLINNLYEILFFVAAVLAMCGAWRAFRKKRAYMKSEEEEDGASRE
ncbi:MAG: peptidase MA family metallohydrolase [Deltaproteobacteria bacterium]